MFRFVGASMTPCREFLQRSYRPKRRFLRFSEYPSSTNPPVEFSVARRAGNQRRVVRTVREHHGRVERCRRMAEPDLALQSILTGGLEVSSGARDRLPAAREESRRPGRVGAEDSDLDGRNRGAVQHPFMGRVEVDARGIEDVSAPRRVLDVEHRHGERDSGFPCRAHVFDVRADWCPCRSSRRTRRHEIHRRRSPCWRGSRAGASRREGPPRVSDLQVDPG